MPGPNSEYSIVLRGRFPGKDRAVAQALARGFARDEGWGLQVVGAAPITVLSGLTAVQAQAAMAALVEVEHAGCRFQSQQGIDHNCPSIQWPSAPKLFGRGIEELTGSGAHAGTGPHPVLELNASCPHCGKSIQVRLAAGLPSPPAPRPVSSQGMPAVPGMLSIPFALPKGSPGTPLPTAASSPSVSGPPPAAPRLPIPIPIPGHNAPKAPAPPHRAAAPVQSPALEPFEVAELEELTPISDGPAAPAAAGTRPPPIRSSGGMPLPEVPIVEGPLAPVAARAPLPVAARDPRMSGPMPMEDFEAGQARKGVAATPPPSTLPIADGTGNGDSGATLKRIAEESPETTCSIFIGKSNNPRVHELVAEIQGITAKEAQRLCQKPVVPIVKDIPVSDADPIKRRFQEINVNARVTIRR